MIGSKLVNRYQVLERIGAGGMAVVYKARCTLLNRTVAIKVLRQQFAADEEFVRRFRREAQSAASLSHPNIVSIYDVGQENETYFIVMEYVEGETLKDYINRQGMLPDKQAVSFTRQVAGALYHAHANNIIHRDIKSHNILLSKDGLVKVTDFGIAQAASSVTQTFAPNSLLGSVHYFSPEQARGQMATAQSDLYSLGIVLYEMLTGALPFEGDSPITIAMQHIQQATPPVREINPDVPSALVGILDKLLAKNPARRYPSASSLISDLRKWQNGGLEQVDSQHEDQETSGTQIYTPVNSGGAESEEEDNGQGFGKTQLIKYGVAALSIVLVGLLGFYAYSFFSGLMVVNEVAVPDVVGLSLQDAAEMLDREGLQYEISSERHHDTIPEGSVMRQLPSAGRVVKQTRVIGLTVSLGPDKVDIPSMVGMDVREAIAQLNLLGLEYEEVAEYSEDFPRDVVMRQSPVASSVLRSEVITLYVSLGPRPLSMEDLTGETEEEARRIIEELLLVVGSVRMEPADEDSPGGIVTWQSPAPGEEIPPGTRVDLRLRPYERHIYNVELDLDPEETSTIRIVVEDFGGKETYHYTISGTDTFSESVRVWEQGTVKVYLNDNLVKEASVPDNGE